MNNRTNKRKRFDDYICRTFMNKLLAIGMFILGALTAYVTGEGNLLVLSLLIGTPLFFSSKNWITIEED